MVTEVTLGSWKSIFFYSKYCQTAKTKTDTMSNGSNPNQFFNGDAKV
jgi:hypothetical protein